MDDDRWGIAVGGSQIIMKKKILAFILTIAVSLFAFGAIGCSSGEYYTTVEVSTYAELKAASKAKNRIVLTDDIDCGYDTLADPIVCYSFDGQGHKITSAVLTGNSFFSGGMEYIKDVTFDDITVNSKGTKNASIVLDFLGKYKKAKTSGIATTFDEVSGTEIKNVTVKNSKLTASRPKSDPVSAGAIVGNSSVSAKIINCKVEKTEITVTGYDNNYSTYKQYVGGIVGAAESANIEGCSVVNSTVSATALNVYDYPYVGGIVGYSSKTNIISSYTSHCGINALARKYSHGITSAYSTSKAYGGGITGYDEGGSSIIYCYAADNNVSVAATGDLGAGGLIGFFGGSAISQSYACDNSVGGDAYASGNSSEILRGVGGLLGYAKNSSVNSCIAYRNTVTDKTGINSDSRAVSRAGGFIGTANSANIKYGATGKNKITADNVDEFAPAGVSCTSCYVTDTFYGNKNSCAVVSESSWTDGEEVTEKLNLTGNRWRFDGGMPALAL